MADEKFTPTVAELTALRARVAQLEAECVDRSSAAVGLNARVAELEAERGTLLRSLTMLSDALRASSDTVSDRDARIAQVLALCEMALLCDNLGERWVRVSEVRALLVPQEGQ